MKTLAVLFGGQATEHEISNLSACFAAENTDKTKYELLMVGITKDGKWFLYTGVAKLDVHLTDAVGEVGPGRVVLVVGIERKPRLLVRELVALGGVDAVGEVASVDVRALVRRHLDARPRLMQRDVGLLCRDEHARQRGDCHSRKQG